MEKDSPGNALLSPFQSTPSPEALRISHHSLRREIPGNVQLDRVPGTFLDGDSSIGKRSAYVMACPNSSTGEFPTPGSPILQTTSKNTKVENQQSRAFKPRCQVSNETSSGKTFERLRKGLGCRTGHPDGHIYICQSRGLPRHFKIGFTTQTIQQRAKQVAHCADDITLVKDGYSVCRVPQNKWLEQTLLHSLASL